jgi:hypothetical protein
MQERRREEHKMRNDRDLEETREREEEGEQLPGLGVT